MTYLTGSLRLLITAAAIIGPFAVASQAHAVSPAVQQACMNDYFRFCSHVDVGSRSLRRCMASKGPRLSRRCVNALVAAGEVSHRVIKRRSTGRRRASRR